MKLTPYIRFVIGGLYALNFLIAELTSIYDKPTDNLFWISEVFGVLVAIVYLAYCVKQGIKELQNDNIELPYPRILAILIEAFNIVAFTYMLTLLKGSQILSILPNLVIVIGMGYLIIQNLKILVGRS
ncbi:MAG: hypothetical protein KI791_16840 [Cyclobacteriaceae bacterium]|nr:hypothetical protein [Cyclobacteriaceae bacterium SS2]